MMRLVPLWLCLAGVLASEAGPLTLVVDYESPPAAASMAAMQKELDRLLQASPLRIDWKLRDDLRAGESVNDLAVVRFRGSCRMETMPIVFDERGPLAFTHTADGEILPFTEVFCDNVRTAARSAMWAGEVARGDELLGRAMARVVAHEVFHMLTKSHDHSEDGVFKKRLSGAQLIAERFDFAAADLKRLR